MNYLWLIPRIDIGLRVPAKAWLARHVFLCSGDAGELMVCIAASTYSRDRPTHPEPSSQPCMLRMLARMMYLMVQPSTQHYCYQFLLVLPSWLFIITTAVDNILWRLGMAGRRAYPFIINVCIFTSLFPPPPLFPCRLARGGLSMQNIIEVCSSTTHAMPNPIVAMLVVSLPLTVQAWVRKMWGSGRWLIPSCFSFLSLHFWHW